MPNIVQKFFEKWNDLETKYSSILCYGYALIAALFLTTMNFLVKTLHHLSSNQIIFYRSIELFLLTYRFMETKQLQFHFKKAKINRLLVLRGIFGLISMSMNFYGLKILPLSEVSVLTQTTPVLVGIFATVLLNEKYEMSQLWGAIFCMTGVVFVVQPEFLFQTAGDDISESDHQYKLIGYIVVLTGTIFVSITHVLVKKVGGETNEGVVTLYLAATASMCAPALALFQGFQTPQLSDLGVIALIGVVSFAAQILRNKAYLLGNPGKVSVMSYIGIIYALLLDVYVLGQDINGYSLLGALCIFSSLFVFLYQAIQKERKKKQSVV